MTIETNRYYSPKDIIVANGGILPMSRSSVYAAIRKGEIPAKQIGKRLLIPGTFLLEFTNKSPQQPPNLGGSF